MLIYNHKRTCWSQLVDARHMPFGDRLMQVIRFSWPAIIPKQLVKIIKVQIIWLNFQPTIVAHFHGIKGMNIALNTRAQ